jgi:DNA-binding LytR/AlgR family response regulator
MKLEVKQSDHVQEIEILVQYHQETDELNHILAALDTINHTIIGIRDNKSFPLNPQDIYYFESVDDRVYAYTQSDAFEVKFKLYELENIFANTSFARISISVILNTRMILHFKSSLNGKMEARLKNEEMISISRSYVSQLKKTLGGQGK